MVPLIDRSPAPQVALDSVWFVWGEHQRVVAERFNAEYQEREVLLVPVGKTRKGRPWVADWRVAKKGAPSEAYS